MLYRISNYNHHHNNKNNNNISSTPKVVRWRHTELQHATCKAKQNMLRHLYFTFRLLYKRRLSWHVQIDFGCHMRHFFSTIYSALLYIAVSFNSLSLHLPICIFLAVSVSICVSVSFEPSLWNTFFLCMSFVVVRVLLFRLLTYVNVLWLSAGLHTTKTISHAILPNWITARLLLMQLRWKIIPLFFLFKVKWPKRSNLNEQTNKSRTKNLLKLKFS